MMQCLTSPCICGQDDSSLHLFFRMILRAYGLAPTQVAPNGWSQVVGSLYIWFKDSFKMEMPLQMFQTVYLMKELPKKKDKGEKTHSLGAILPSSLWTSIYHTPSVERHYKALLDKRSRLIKLGQMASKGKHTQPTLALRVKLKPLQPGSSEDSKQKKVIEEIICEVAHEELERLAEMDVLEGGVLLARKWKEAYTNFSNYFASVGHQEVMATLQLEHPDLDITFLEAMFPPMNIEDDGKE
ncbi:hypothetical protein Adt_39838 [Abeliophyllum distichum]|uniref:Uncharacterized protein n=1 Tax=Abeliophyllum distichum TaxID=126358 RepID=A0ABD1Q692_9LAMI